MQRTLYKLIAWANRCDMDFNVNMCRVMHIGKINQYQMNDEWVKSVGVGRDLGVLISKRLEILKTMSVGKK